MRVLMALACRSLGDEETSELELACGQSRVRAVGSRAGYSLASNSLGNRTTSAHGHGLTPRELQVLRLITAGKTNKAIATELFLSERTIDRHVSNILTKLNVPSRAAATAYAYDHKLL